MTSYDIYREFLSKANDNLKKKIIDFRPCKKPCYHEDIENTICVYFTDGGELLYTAQNEPVCDFKSIVGRIDQIAQEELIRANKKNPAFHSKHEGIGVLLEEKQEAMQDFSKMIADIATVVEVAFKDGDYKPDLEKARQHALYAAAETVQVIAMCDKLKAVE